MVTLRSRSSHRTPKPQDDFHLRVVDEVAVPTLRVEDLVGLRWSKATAGGKRAALAMIDRH